MQVLETYEIRKEKLELQEKSGYYYIMWNDAIYRSSRSEEHIYEMWDETCAEAMAEAGFDW